MFQLRAFNKFLEDDVKDRRNLFALGVDATTGTLRDDNGKVGRLIACRSSRYHVLVEQEIFERGNVDKL